MDTGYLLQLIASAVALMLGITIHESAHAFTAYLLGDRTARDRGRVSFNPLAHIDPFGTLLLPLLLIAAGGPVFAFAKPVPVYLGNLRHPKRDELLVSLAGPVSNIVLAFSAAWLLRAWIGAVPFGLGMIEASRLVAQFAFVMISVNLSLAFFNLIPLPPLDGSSILVLLLKGPALRKYYEIQRYSMPILLIVLYILPSVFHVDALGWYFDLTVYPLQNLFVSFALGL